MSTASLMAFIRRYCIRRSREFWLRFSQKSSAHVLRTSTNEFKSASQRDLDNQNLGTVALSCHTQNLAQW